MFAGGPRASRIARLVYHFPNFVRLFRALWNDPRVPIYRKAIPALGGAVSVLLGLAYFLWRIDLIWDFLPIVGKVDDILILMALTFIPAMWLFLKVAPPDIVADRVREIDDANRAR